MSMVCRCCAKRSTSAATQAAPGNTVPHCSRHCSRPGRRMPPEDHVPGLPARYPPSVGYHNPSFVGVYERRIPVGTKVFDLFIANAVDDDGNAWKAFTVDGQLVAADNRVFEEQGELVDIWPDP